MRRLSPKTSRARRATREALAEWRASQVRCHCCHKPEGQPGGFEAHRIIKGKDYDPRNLLYLCGSFSAVRCHDLFESHRVRRSDGTLWPHLTLANALWLKMTEDSDNYDGSYLQSLYGRWTMPEPRKLPHWFLAEREKWRT